MQTREESNGRMLKIHITEGKITVSFSINSYAIIIKAKNRHTLLYRQQYYITDYAEISGYPLSS